MIGIRVVVEGIRTTVGLLFLSTDGGCTGARLRTEGTGVSRTAAVGSVAEPTTKRSLMLNLSTDGANFVGMKERGREGERESGCVGFGERDQDFGQARPRVEGILPTNYTN